MTSGVEAEEEKGRWRVVSIRKRTIAETELHQFESRLLSAEVTNIPQAAPWLTFNHANSAAAILG